MRETEGLVQRCVIVARDPDGFGFRVTGDHPVFIQTVKDDGAACRAGVRQGDRIIKVNGTTVTDANHLQVCQMISASDDYVALNLLGKPGTPILRSPKRSKDFDRPLSLPSQPTITGPQPLNEEKQAEWRRRRVAILTQMLEEETRHLEGLKTELRRVNRRESSTSRGVDSGRLRERIEAAGGRVANLHAQLDSIHPPPKPHPNPDTQAGETLGMSADEAGASAAEDGMSFVKPGQVDVVPMDDSDEEEEAVLDLDTSGPFSNLPDLKSRLGHLSVFLHYLLSNSDPASLLFYLITDLYEAGNSAKELRKWAFEIHSSFLVPTAPFRVARIDSDIVAEIDAALLPGPGEDVGSLRRIFVRSRQAALDDVRERLCDFRAKRMLGLGNVFGESYLDGLDAATSADAEKAKELKVADALLMPHFETLFAASSEFDKLPSRQQATAAALATLVKGVMGLRPSCNLQEKLLDRCPVYCGREKGLKHKLKISASKKSVSLKGHQLNLSQVSSTTQCYQCREMVWGINPQAYFCGHCDVIVHKSCMGSLEDHCYPATQKKSRPIPTTKSAKELSHPIHEEAEPGIHGVEDLGEERDLVPSQLPGSPRGKGVAMGVGDWSGKSSDSGYEGDLDRQALLDQRSTIARSQSMKTRDENVRSSKRLGAELSARRAKSDVDGDDKAIALAMAARGGEHNSSSSSVHSVAAADLSDSDMEADPDGASLEEVLSPDVLKFLKPKEKKRQEVLNELFHTERTHVGKLKILHRHFQNPLLVNQILHPDTVKVLFGNIEEMLEIHESFNKALKAKRKEEMSKDGLFGDVGELVCSFLDGEAGERFASVAANFCQHQQYALNELRVRQKKEGKLAGFLTEAEAHPICRRLQLKDLIPVEMQRLTKYPLLLETVGKYTAEETAESAALKKGLEAAKRILHAVNVAKRTSENRRRLAELQARLDSGPFDKEAHPMSREFKGLNLCDHSLVHDGHLAWRLGKNKVVELHVVLVERLLILLTRAGDARLALKYYDMAQMPDGKWCPVLKLKSTMAKTVATDKKAFFLVSTSATGPQIYELVAASMQEKKTWLALISEQAELCREAAKAPIATDDTISLASSELRPETLSSSGSSGLVETGGGTGPSPSGRDVQLIAMSSQPRLINPSEIAVAQPTILQHAQPILTPLERLRRQDVVLARALAEKLSVVSELLELPGGAEELQKVAQGLADSVRPPRDTKELVMSAIVQSNHLLEAINDGMRLAAVTSAAPDAAEVKLEAPKADGPSVPCLRLATIAAPLMRHLTAIMHSMQATEEELRRTRLELAHFKTQAEAHSRTHVAPPVVEIAAAVTDSDLGSSPSSVGSCHLHLGSEEGAVSGLPGLAVGSASSEETLIGTPLVKTPDSLPLTSSSPTPTGSLAGQPSPKPSPAQSQAVSPSGERRSSASEEEERRRLAEKRKQKRERQEAHLTPDPDDSKKQPPK